MKSKIHPSERIPREQLRREGLVHVEVGGQRLLLLETQTGPRCYVNLCSHQCRVMESPGYDGAGVRCDHHSVTFDAETGEVASDRGFLGLSALQPVPVVVTGDSVEVRMTDS